MAVVPIQVSPSEYVERLVRKAGEADVSGAAQNFAKAALDAAQALFTINQMNRVFSDGSVGQAAVAQSVG